VIHPPILPSCLDFLSPPHAPKNHIPPISAHVVVVLPLTDNVKYIDSGPRFSFPQQVHPVPLAPLLLAFKNRRSSKIILQIIALLVASVGAAATLKQDLCVSPIAPSFSMACCRCNLTPGRNRILIAYGRMANSIFLQGSQRKRVWILTYCQTIPPPPPKENVCNAPE
jgi:hypothetical protein